MNDAGRMCMLQGIGDAEHFERVRKACHDLWIDVVDGAAATAEPDVTEERPIHAD